MTKHAVLTSAALLTTLALVASACGGPSATSSTTTEPTSPREPTSMPTTTTSVESPSSTQAPSAVGDAEVVLVAELVGGCAMLGPNCPTYVLWSDGRAIVARGRLAADPFTERLDDSAIEQVGFIASEIAADVAAVITTTDFSALVARLGPGRCNACVDGIDTVLTVAGTDGQVVLVSAEVEFDASEPFFAAVDAAIRAMGSELDLPIVSR